ncbi:MAG TPA: deoxyribodipyrimidine photo-lyase, partial [Gammaproteobacteria bacterium]
MNTAIVWFRRDLRLHNNPALNWACGHCDAILPVFIHSPEEDSPWQPGGASRWWLDKSLRALEADLKNYGLTLQCYTGNSSKILGDLINTSKAQSVVFNRLYEPHLHHRDESLIKTLNKLSVDVRGFDTGLFFKPGIILNNQNLPYRVYTPFSKRIRSKLHEIDTNFSSNIQKLKSIKTVHPDKSGYIDDLNLNDHFNWYAKLEHYWQPGEQQALLRIHEFLEHILCDYDSQRDIPSVDGTSALSAHLH